MPLPDTAVDSSNLSSESPSRLRLHSLDVFRGLTIAGMVLVNNAGDWSAVYPPLLHADWHGWTPTDLVFPFFLLIVGVAIPMALENRRATGGSMSDLHRKIARRTLLIFLLGLLLNWFPPHPSAWERLQTLRIPGVLQRIAICYGVAALLFLRLGRRGMLFLTGGILVGYWMLLTWIPAPGGVAGDLSREGSLPSWIDRTLLAGHIYRPSYDPEGILSTLPALATTLIGVLAGQWLRSTRPPMERAAGLFAVGILCLLAGWAWDGFFPINKALWTSSYVLFTGGIGLQLLALCFWLVDLQGFRAWAFPFVVLGVNALALFVLTGLAADLLQVIRVTGPDGLSIPLQAIFYRRLFTNWLSPRNGSVAYALTFLAFWWVVMWGLYRRRLFLRL
ncbi:MAG: acyltransferase family protein [Blastocatellia bacterium]